MLSNTKVVDKSPKGPEPTLAGLPLKNTAFDEPQEPSAKSQTVDEAKTSESDTGMSVSETGNKKCLLCNQHLGSNEELQDHCRCRTDQEVDRESKQSTGTRQDETEHGKISKKSRRKGSISIHSQKSDGFLKEETTSDVLPFKDKEDDVPQEPATKSQSLPEIKTSKGETVMGSQKCVLCNQCFGSKEELQKHFRRHANQEIDITGKPRSKQVNDECDSNSKKSTKTADISEDVKNSDTGNAVCDVCGEEFRTVSLAISHKFRKHPNSSAKYYCPHCGMMFPIKVNRDNHIKTHPSVTPKELYPCLVCSVSFFSLRALKFHVDSAHKRSARLLSPVDTPAPSLKIVLNNAGEPCSIYYCHLCGCEYQIKYNLQRHLETKHSELERTAVPEEVIQCNLCKALFCSKRAYEVHNHHHRPSDLYATDEIVRQSLIQRKDQDFDFRRVPTTVERYLSACAVYSNRAATWRNIRAARQKEEAAKTHPKSKAAEAKELVVNIDSKYVPVSSANSPTEHLDSESSLSPSSLNIGRRDLLEDGNNTKEDEKFIHGENMCWVADSKTMNEKRMLNDSEEDDCEIRSLGLVNPDTVLASRRLICGNPVEELSTLSSSNNTMNEISNEKDDTLKSDEGSIEDKINCRTVKCERRKSNMVQEDDGEADCSGLVVEKILAVRRKSTGREFLVRWRGFEPADDTWEKEEMLHCVELIVDFLKNRRTKRERPDIEWYAAKKKGKKIRVKSLQKE